MRAERPAILSGALLVAAIAILLAGCAENAVLELELQLPAQADACGADAIGLEARTAAQGACFFEQEWFDGDAAVIALDAERTHAVSVVADADEVELALCLRMRACASAESCPPADVTLGARTEIEIPRAFYRGEYTKLGLERVDPCASASRTIDRCDVEGCAGGAPLETFCDDEGLHLCE